MKGAKVDREEQRRIVREQRAGFAALRQFEIEQMRKATFADRLDSFCRVMGFVEAMDKPISRRDDEYLAGRWQLIRRRYERALGR